MDFPKHHKYYPTVEVKYYINKKKSGDYSSKSRLIRIYVNNHQTIEELVDTCIHEYTHYLQLAKETQQLEYTKYNKTKGYFNNPYEIDARKKAKFYTPKCIKDFKKLGYIS
jgi:Zn-dependent peptidase ImmA (M78 family)